MTRLIKLFLLTAVLALSVVAAPAMASPLSDAKAAGYLGERADGYLGVVKSNAPAAVKKLAKSVNQKRRAKYKSIAKRNKTKLNAVEALVGEKLIKRTAKGQFVMGPKGRWRKK